MSVINSVFIQDPVSTFELVALLATTLFLAKTSLRWSTTQQIEVPRGVFSFNKRVHRLFDVGATISLPKQYLQSQRS